MDEGSCQTLPLGVRPLSPDLVYLGRSSMSAYWTNEGSGTKSDKTWDEARWQEALNLAGDGRAGTLPTAQHALDTQGVRQLIASRNRLLVVFGSSMQLWQVDGTPAQMGKLDAAPIGAGSQPAIRGAVTGGVAVIPSSRGISVMQLTGQLTDRIDSTDLSFAIFGSGQGLLGVPVVHDVVFWPNMSAVVAAVTLPGATSPTLWAFMRDQNGKSLGWWRWTVPGLASVRPGGMAVVGDRLLIHGAWATLVYTLDASASQAGKGTVGSVAFAYQHGGEPRNWKRWISMDFQSAGQVQLSVTPLSTRTPRSLGALTSSSYQRRPVALMFADTAAAFQMTLAEVDGKARIDRLEIRATSFVR
jgi:hypothetical protein